MNPANVAKTTLGGFKPKLSPEALEVVKPANSEPMKIVVDRLNDEEDSSAEERLKANKKKEDSMWSYATTDGEEDSDNLENAISPQLKAYVQWEKDEEEKKRSITGKSVQSHENLSVSPNSRPKQSMFAEFFKPRQRG